MNADPIERPVPFTFNRAVTELVQASRELDRANGSLVLALEIVDAISRGTGEPLRGSLRHVLDVVQDAEAELDAVLNTDRPGRPWLAARSA
jgi:hypothetical protein